MSWSGSSLLAVVRDGIWRLLVLAGVAWLAIGWSVLRLEPADIVTVAGPVVLFGALTEALRAFAGAKTWWLNAGMALLFAATGVVLLAEQDSSYTTPAALIGWYLMVRGALDVAVAMMTRETDRVWGLLMVVGVLEAGLGFFAASPLSRTADLVVVIVGALAMLRAEADLVTGLRLRDVRAARADILELSPERALGVAGYSAGRSDYESEPARSRARHRAQPRSTAAALSALDGSGSATGGNPATGRLGSGGAATWPGTPGAGTPGAGTPGSGTPGAGTPGASTPAPSSGGGTGGGTAAGNTFHDEVLRTTADLDTMLALAGVTGAGAGAHLVDYDLPEVPDTPEGVELPDDARTAGEDRSGETAVRSDAAPADRAPDRPEDGGLPILDPTTRSPHESPDLDDTAISAGGGHRAD